MSKRSVSRRRLLRAGAAAAAGWQLARGPFVVAADTLKSTKLGIAVIGCGGMGSGNPGVAAGERLVALCDVDEGPIAKAVEKLKDKAASVPVYYDYRKMIEEKQKEIDLVLIATPDHHHAPAAIRAMALGKHAFVQKPLAHDIYECRALAEAAKKYKVQTQMGNQGHCGEGYRRLCEYIWAGAIGPVRETHSILGRNFGGKGGRPAGKPVPKGVHWDEWLGPAAPREYHDGLHPFSWRSWKDFGTGTLGDMACHVMDGIFWALKIKEAPSYAIECLKQTDGSGEMFTQNNILRWDVPARADMPALKVFTYDNRGNKPEVWKEAEAKAGRELKEGTIYIGDKGIMHTGTYGDGVRMIPEEAHKAFPVPDAKIPRVKGGPIPDLIRAIKGEGPAPTLPPCSNFADSAGPFTEFVLSGLLAMAAGPGRKVEWDVAGMTCTNAPELNALVKRTARPGWEV